MTDPAQVRWLRRSCRGSARFFRKVPGCRIYRLGIQPVHHGNPHRVAPAGVQEARTFSTCTPARAGLSESSLIGQPPRFARKTFLARKDPHGLASRGRDTRGAWCVRVARDGCRPGLDTAGRWRRVARLSARCGAGRPGCTPGAHERPPGGLTRTSRDAARLALPSCALRWAHSLDAKRALNVRCALGGARVRFASDGLAL